MNRIEAIWIWAITLPTQVFGAGAIFFAYGLLDLELEACALIVGVSVVIALSVSVWAIWQEPHSTATRIGRIAITLVAIPSVFVSGAPILFLAATAIGEAAGTW